MRTFLATFAILVLMQPASAFIAANDLVVEDLGGDRFSVPYHGLSGDSDFWCAAGDYVIRDLGLAPSTRIYRTTPPPRRSGQGITFSLSKEGAQSPGWLVFSRDDGLRASFARSLCDLPNLIDR